MIGIVHVHCHTSEKMSACVVCVKIQNIFSVVLLCFHATASEYLEGPSEYDPWEGLY